MAITYIKTKEFENLDIDPPIPLSAIFVDNLRFYVSIKCYKLQTLNFAMQNKDFGP